MMSRVSAVTCLVILSYLKVLRSDAAGGYAKGLIDLVIGLALDLRHAFRSLKVAFIAPAWHLDIALPHKDVFGLRNQLNNSN